MTRSLVILLIAAALPTAPAQKRQNIYDEDMKAPEQIAAALKKAERDSKRVMLVFGANWCGWCHKLSDAFKRPELRKTVRDEYVVVKVDIGKWNKHLDVLEKYDADIKKHGVPFITVLASDGSLVKNQPTSPLEEGKVHSTEKVLAFLNENKAKQKNANDVLAGALADAKKTERKVLVHLGAPW